MPLLEDGVLRDKTEIKKRVVRVAAIVEAHSWGCAHGKPASVASAVMLECRLPSPCPEYERYTAGILVCPTDSVWVADDKAKTMAWLAKKGCFQQAAADLVQQDPMHWCKEQTCLEDQGNINRDLHRRMARRLRCGVSGPDKWRSSSMPYMYMSVKSKCYDEKKKKPGHSHLRKNCSWFKHPATSFYRGASRATSIAVNRLKVGWEARSLKTASHDLKDPWERMMAERGTRKLAPSAAAVARCSLGTR